MSWWTTSKFWKMFSKGEYSYKRGSFLICMPLKKSSLSKISVSNSIWMIVSVSGHLQKSCFGPLSWSVRLWSKKYSLAGRSEFEGAWDEGSVGFDVGEVAGLYCAAGRVGKKPIMPIFQVAELQIMAHFNLWNKKWWKCPYPYHGM